MSKKFLELFIAWRYLIHRTGDGFISLISIFSFVGITLGVATLIIVMSVMNGFHEKLIDNIVGIGGHINISSNYGEIDAYQKIIEDLKTNNDVRKVISMVQGQALASSDNTNSGVLVFGIENLNDKKALLKGVELSENFNNEKKILIGARLAESINLHIGDSLNLVSSKSLSSVLGEIPRMKSYEIGGIFESGVYDFDLSTIFIPLKQAQLFFQVYDSVNKLEIYLSSPTISQKVTQDLRKKFEDYQGLLINDWQDANSHYLGALESEKSVMFLILSLIILIAMFNVVSSLVMMVTEKQKSIAILRSFGMSEWSIMRIFIYCGMIISVTSTILGFILGVLFTWNINSIKHFIERIFNVNLFDRSIYIFSEMPSKIDYHDAIYVVIFSLVLSLLAVIYPSRKASKIDPASVLRYL